MQIDSNS